LPTSHHHSNAIHKKCKGLWEHTCATRVCGWLNQCKDLKTKDLKVHSKLSPWKMNETNGLINLNYWRAWSQTINWYIPKIKISKSETYDYKCGNNPNTLGTYTLFWVFKATEDMKVWKKLYVPFFNSIKLDFFLI
jgi:hypothetical protein